MGSRRWTWSQLDERVAAMAGTLVTCGLEPGDRLAIVAPNSPEFVIAYFAGLRMGAVVVAVNTRLAPPELAHILTDSGARVVLVGADERPTVERAVTMVAADASVAIRDLAGVLEQAAAAPVLSDRATEDDDALIVYTSGTTGRPKGYCTHIALRRGPRSLRSPRSA
jgi:fatty-acyl-CoA synthase